MPQVPCVEDLDHGLPCLRLFPKYGYHCFELAGGFSFSGEYTWSICPVDPAIFLDLVFVALDVVLDEVARITAGQIPSQFTKCAEDLPAFLSVAQSGERIRKFQKYIAHFPIWSSACRCDPLAIFQNPLERAFKQIIKRLAANAHGVNRPARCPVWLSASSFFCPIDF